VGFCSNPTGIFLAGTYTKQVTKTSVSPTGICVGTRRNVCRWPCGFLHGSYEIFFAGVFIIDAASRTWATLRMSAEC
jgi:hypothetical protein